MSSTALVEALLDALPQTQCRRCGYADCSAYAQAMAADEAAINRCPPGGAEGISRLAQISGRPALPLDPAVGHEAPRGLAQIDEAWCIGCTLCIKACPVDCIVGAAKQMHTVIDADCTGCALCVPACPVDCIALVPVSGTRTGWQTWSAEQAGHARERYALHQLRSQQSEPATPAEAPGPAQALVAAALARAREARRP